MDNARIHHGDEIIELIEGHGILLNSLTTLLTCFRRTLEYLPPYSPDLNPIEEAFSKVKAFLRRHQALLCIDVNGIIADMLQGADSSLQAS